MQTYNTSICFNYLLTYTHFCDNRRKVYNFSCLCDLSNSCQLSLLRQTSLHHKINTSFYFTSTSKKDRCNKLHVYSLFTSGSTGSRKLLIEIHCLSYQDTENSVTNNCFIEILQLMTSEYFFQLFPSRWAFVISLEKKLRKL